MAFLGWGKDRRLASAVVLMLSINLEILRAGDQPMDGHGAARGMESRVFRRFPVLAALDHAIADANVGLDILR